MVMINIKINYYDRYICENIQITKTLHYIQFNVYITLFVEVAMLDRRRKHRKHKHMSDYEEDITEEFFK